MMVYEKLIRPGNRCAEHKAKIKPTLELELEALGLWKAEIKT